MTHPADVASGRTAMAGQPAPRVNGVVSIPHYVPPVWFEYWYYAQVFYAVMGAALGVSIGSVGVAALGLLAGCCVLRTGRRSLAILLPVALPIAVGVSYIAVQMFVFGEAITGGEVRSFVPWILGIVVIQCLALRRGFLHRFAMAVFLIGLGTLPYLTLYGGSLQRAGLDRQIGIANPNDLSAWFAFCCLYFAVLGFETRRMAVRLMSWSAATGCLFIVGLTVSRAPLFAAAVGILVAFRRVLKRGFVPFLSLVVVAWIVYGLGVFDQAASFYASRGLEDTGRFLVWPLAIERFFNTPLAGVGASDVATYIPQRNGALTPHNSFIFIALASGVLPLLLFIAYWVRLGAEAFRLYTHSHEDAAFVVPLFLYVLMIALQLDKSFMSPWTMATLGTIGATGFLLKARRAVAGRMGVRQGARRRNHSGSTRFATPMPPSP